jgi:hypothetical protein
VNDYYRNIETAILSALRGITYGSVTVRVQDGKIIQMEKIEKLRFNRDGNLMGQHVPQTGLTEEKPIGTAFTDLQYGQVTFVIRDGSIMQIERMEKKRLLNNQGLHGEGI